MNQNLLNRINKAFNIKLVEEDLAKPGFKYFIGKYQKSKRDTVNCRLFVDTVIEIKGYDRFAIGIRSYSLNNPICDCCFAYLGYWKEKNDKKYNAKSYPVNDIEHAFNDVYRQQKYTLPCTKVTLNGITYVQLLLDNTKDQVYLYNVTKGKVEIVDKDLYYKAELQPIPRDDCEPLYTTVNIDVNGIPFNIEEYLFGTYLKQYYEKILLEYKKLTSNVDITKWVKP